MATRSQFFCRGKPKAIFTTRSNNQIMSQLRKCGRKCRSSWWHPRALKWSVIDRGFWRYRTIDNFPLIGKCVHGYINGHVTLGY